MKILLLEDDPILLDIISHHLQESGFELLHVRDGKSALEEASAQRFDLFIFDINVPKMSGLELIKALREDGNTTPTILITAYQDTKHMKSGFESGCDDYIKKPFDLDELWLRMQAVIKRSLGLRDDKIYINDFTYLNLKRKNIVINEEEILLNLKDFELLQLLVSQRGKVVTKEMIEEKLWGLNEVPNSGSIRVYINNLKKIFGKDAITNIRGIGYRFEEF